MWPGTSDIAPRRKKRMPKKRNDVLIPSGVLYVQQSSSVGWLDLLDAIGVTLGSCGVSTPAVLVDRFQRVTFGAALTAVEKIRGPNELSLQNVPCNIQRP